MTSRQTDPESEFRDLPFAPLDTHWSQNMVQCPKCQSANLRHNHVQNKSFLDTAGAAIDKHRTGRTAHALGELALWSVFAAYNRTRPEWVCDHCGGAF